MNKIANYLIKQAEEDVQKTDPYQARLDDIEKAETTGLLSGAGIGALGGGALGAYLSHKFGGGDTMRLGIQGGSVLGALLGAGTGYAAARGIYGDEIKSLQHKGYKY